MDPIVGRDCSIDSLCEKIEAAPGFSFSKTQFQELARSLNAPDDTIQVLRRKCVHGELSYSRVVRTLLDDWTKRVKEKATITSLLKAMCISNWRTVADYLKTEVENISLKFFNQPGGSQDHLGWKKCGTIEFNVNKIIGQGSFGTVVYQGRWNDRKVAVKKIICETGEEIKVGDEINALLDCDGHENIVKYYKMEKFANDDSYVPVIFIALELCNFTLKAWMDQRDECFDIDVHPIEILHQTTKGVSFLHENKIVHRDIKPENILFVQISPTLVRIKICDFGISRRMSLERTSLTLKTSSGTLGWMAPEIIQVLVDPDARTKSKMSAKTDIFSLGCVFYYVLAHGIHPFGDNTVDIQSNVLNYRPNISNGQLINLYLGFLPLILLMVNKNQNERPSADVILSHHIFWSPKTKLDFLVAVSNAVARPEHGSPTAICIDTVENHPLLVDFCKPYDSAGWMRFLSSPVRKFVTGKHVKKAGKYECSLIADLLRAIRNMKIHHVSLPDEVLKTIGPLDETFLEYWLIRFPILIDVVWCVFEHLKYDAMVGLSNFYSGKHDFSKHTLTYDQTRFLRGLIKHHCAVLLHHHNYI